MTIDIPEYSIGLYEITKNGTKFQRRSGMSEVPTEFSFSFRVDRNYDIYLGFLTWLRLCRDSVTGVMAPESVIRFPISVAPVDTGGNQLSNGWIFQGCFPSNMSGLTFDEDSGDPLTVDITMQMLGYDPVIL
ncbi:MAG: hypothetical protein PF569_10335 [Candidatus Woesearchaeota archaeon]|nr:hypothetical protein [Candidatus Woesearchaeota archaeon]